MKPIINNMAPPSVHLCTYNLNYIGYRASGTLEPVVPEPVGTMMPAQNPRTTGGRDRPFNNLLRWLSASDFALLAPDLIPEEAAASELLYNPGDDVEIVHFP